MYREKIYVQFKLAADGQIAQAERTVKRSHLKRVAGNPGDNATIHIPLADRGRGNLHNIMIATVVRDESDSYRIAVDTGLIK